eukprot:SAG11_NODE_700_length_7673_cov_7.359255_7_plen_107_part_00
MLIKQNIRGYSTDLDNIYKKVLSTLYHGKVLGAAPFLDPALPHLPVGGRMQHFAPLWAALIDDPFATSACFEGIVPQLHTVPRYRGPAPVRPLKTDMVQPMQDMVA